MRTCLIQLSRTAVVSKSLATATSLICPISTRTQDDDGKQFLDRFVAGLSRIAASRCDRPVSSIARNEWRLVLLGGSGKSKTISLDYAHCPRCAI